MVRAAAKNYHRVAAVTDPADYVPLLEELSGGGALGLGTRFRLAQKAFALTAGYDTAIASYFARLSFAEAAGSYTLRGS
jgi:phosphoribosylaminoimidazolecarboxamide formyltransferase/IMP cyclohydrolase